MLFITGTTGTVGSEVIKQLSEKGVKIRAAVHTPSKAEMLKGYNVEIVAFDFDKPETYDAALEGVEKVFFLGYANPTFTETSRRFAEAAKAAGVVHFVKLSAYGADFAPEFLIAKAHRESEEAIESTGIAYTHLRPNVFMQNFINYHGHLIKSSGKLYLPHGDANVSFIDVRDVATAAVDVLTHGGHEGKGYTLTGSEVLSYYQATEMLSQAAGRKILYVDISKEEARKQLAAMGQPDFFVEISLNMADFSKSGGFSRITTVYEEITGKKPIAFAQFAKDYVEAFK